MYSLPMIAAHNPRASAQWYRRLLACDADDDAEDFSRLRYRGVYAKALAGLLARGLVGDRRDP
jgi:hypothetical protein